MLHRPAHIPLLLPTGLFIAGLLIGFSGASPAYAMLLLIVTGIAPFFRRPALAAYAAILAIGWFDGALHTAPPLPHVYSGKELVWSGRVTRVVETESAINADVEIDSMGTTPGHLMAATPRTVRLTVAGFGPDITETCRVSWKGILTPPDHRPRLPEMTDLSQSMRRRGVSATCIVRPEQIVSVTERPGLLNDMRRWRTTLSGLLFDSGLSPDSERLLNAVLLGDTSLITPDQREVYSNAGLSHLLALSGMHVAIIAMILSVALAPLYLLRRRRTLTVLILTALWVYAAMTGLSPSVVRAVIMATAFAGSMMLQRRPSPFNSLCLAALIILLINPYALPSYGFQLSFSAVAAIITFARPLNPVSPRRHLAHTLTGYLCVCVAAMLGTGVVAAYHFHAFPLYFIIPATAATLLMPVICGGGIIAMAACACGVTIPPIVRLTDLCCDWLDAIASGVASWPCASIGGLYFTPSVLCLFIAAIGMMAVWANTRRAAFGIAALMLASSGAVAAWITGPRPEGGSRVMLVPDHQHAILLIRHGDGCWIAATTHPADSGLVKLRMERDFARYMAVNGVTTLRMMPDSLSMSGLNVSDGIISVCGRDISFVPSANATGPLTYAILSQRARSNDIPACANADTIVTPLCVSPRLAAKVAAQTAPRPIVSTLDVHIR